MRSFHRNLTVQVLFAISIGVLLGLVAPGAARAMKPVGDTFVNLVRMVIAPVIFLTVTLGIANMRDLKQVGRVGGKALLYFEIVTTFALAIGLIVVNVTKPGAGLDVSALAKGDISKYAEAGKAMSFVEILTHIVPASVVDASRAATSPRRSLSRCREPLVPRATDPWLRARHRVRSTPVP